VKKFRGVEILEMDSSYLFVKDVMLLNVFLTVVKEDFAILVPMVKLKNGVDYLPMMW
jgi:hypothetical protein